MSDFSESERATLLQAFIDARNEKDRSIFLSAVGGIGFSTTMLFNTELTTNHSLVVFLAISLVLFAIAAAAILVVFNANATLIQQLLNDPFSDTRSTLVEISDWVAVGSFMLAILSIGAAIIVHLTCTTT